MSGSEPERTKGADLRLVPAALAAWCGMWVATSAQAAWLSLGVVSALACAAWGWRRKSWAMGAVAVVLLGCMLIGWARWWWRANDPLIQLAEAQAVATAEITVVGTAHSGEPSGPRPAWWLSMAKLQLIEARGERLVSGATVQVNASGDALAGWTSVIPGARVRAVVRLAPAEPGDAATVVLRAREPPVLISPPGPVDAAVERVRVGLRTSVAHLDLEPRALVPALVVGDTSAMPADLVERFRVTGLTHLTAVSGANLTLLLAFLATMARWCGVTGWWLRCLLGLGVIGFVVLCHAEPSVVRAAAMGLVGLVALGAGGSAGQAVRALSIAVILIVFVDPGMSRSAGFALSVMASAGIVAWARPWTDALTHRIPRIVAEGIATPLAAQLATQPLVTVLSGHISLAGVLANLAAGPLVGPATVLGFVAAAVALPVLPLAVVFGTGAGWCAQGLCWIARLGELFPGAAVSWPAHPVGVAVVLAGCVGAVLVLPRVLRSGLLVAAVAVLLLAALVRPFNPPGWPPGAWDAVFCDVGQGDATVLRVGPREAALVDAGPDEAKLRACLHGLGIERVPLVILTHFHADHVTGIDAAMNSNTTTTVAVSSATTPAPGRQLVSRSASTVGLTTVTTGSRLSVGAVEIEVFAVRGVSAVGTVEGESAAENDGSLVMRVSVGDLRILLPGDVQEEGQRHALASGADLEADVLLVPHHGSSHQLPEFLAATRARIAVFSAGQDNDYGHPSVRTQRAVQQLGMDIVRTDTQGSIALARSGDTITVTTQR